MDIRDINIIFWWRNIEKWELILPATVATTDREFTGHGSVVEWEVDGRTCTGLEVFPQGAWWPLQPSTSKCTLCISDICIA